MRSGTIRFTAVSRGVAAQLTHTPRAGAIVLTWSAGSDTRREFGTVVVRDGAPKLRPLHTGQYRPVEFSPEELAAVAQVMTYFADWCREDPE